MIITLLFEHIHIVTPNLSCILMRICIVVRSSEIKTLFSKTKTRRNWFCDLRSSISELINLRVEYLLNRYQGVWAVLQCPLLSMNRLNQTESATFAVCFDFGAFEGSPFLEFKAMPRWP
jgi:hypothetical protein